MRLHFLIFAVLRGTPFVALPYASKVMGLLEDLDVETPELGSVGIGSLLARIDRCWDTRKEIRQGLDSGCRRSRGERSRPTIF
jgi:polysaccharide pyruvyl transferase WcaK-like protein